MYRNLTKLSRGGVVAVALLAFGSTFILAPAWASHEPGHDATARSQAAENAQGIVAVDQDIDTLKLRILELEATVQDLRNQITNIQLIPGPAGPAGPAGPPGPPGPLPDLSAIQAQIDAIQAQIDAISTKIIFVSSSRHTGELGGLSGADAICQALADTAGIGGVREYKAWLANNDNDDPESRFFQNPGPYELPNGDIVAYNWADLTDGSLAWPINRDENGNPLTGQFDFQDSVWTNVGVTGRQSDHIQPGNCTIWTGGDVRGGVGNTDYVDSRWTSKTSRDCHFVNARLFCVEQ